MLKRFTDSKIPIWVNIVQILLVLIMLMQVFWNYFNHPLLLEQGVTIGGIPDLNLIYTLGGRTATMAAGAIFVLITQIPKQFLVVLFMNIVREGQEMFIDPLFPVANADATPAVDFGIHVVIVAIEILAFIAVYRIVKREDKADVSQAAMT